LLLFSLSRFQLPFYTNAIFPLFAIVTAPVCLGTLSKFGTKFRLIVQWIFIILLPIAVIGLNMLLKPANNFYIITDVLLFGIIAALVIIKISEASKKVFLLSCLATLFAGLYVNTVLYNEIVPYKGQIVAAAYVNQPKFDGFHLYVLNAENNLYQFYCKRPVDLLPIEQFDRFKPADSSVFYVNQLSMDYLLQIHAHFRVIRIFTDYPKENVLPAFINANTRYTVLGRIYLIGK
jgi:hypothetical protein